MIGRGDGTQAAKVDIAVNAVISTGQLLQECEGSIEGMDKANYRLWKELVRRRVGDGMAIPEAVTFEDEEDAEDLYLSWQGDCAKDGISSYIVEARLQEAAERFRLSRPISPRPEGRAP